MPILFNRLKNSLYLTMIWKIIDNGLSNLIEAGVSNPTPFWIGVVA